MYRFETIIVVSSLFFSLFGGCSKKENKTEKKTESKEEIKKPVEKWPGVEKIWEREFNSLVFAAGSDASNVYAFGFKKGKKTFKPTGQWLLDATTGVSRWFAKRNPSLFRWNSPMGLNAELMPDRVIYSSPHQVSVLDLATGKHPKNIRGKGFVNLPDGRIFISADIPYFLKPDGKKTEVALKQMISTIPVKISKFFKPVLASNTILIRTADGLLRGIDTVSEKEKWQFQHEPDSMEHATDLVWADKTLLVPTVYPDTLPGSIITWKNAGVDQSVKVDGLVIPRSDFYLSDNILTVYSRLSSGSVILHGIDIAKKAVLYSKPIPSNNCTSDNIYTACRHGTTLLIYSRTSGELIKNLVYSRNIRFITLMEKRIALQLSDGRYHIVSVPDGKSLFSGDIIIKDMKTWLRKLVWARGDRIGLVVSADHPRNDKLSKMYLRIFSLAMNFAGSDIYLGKIPPKTTNSMIPGHNAEISLDLAVWATKNRILSALDNGVKSINPETGTNVGGFSLPGPEKWPVMLVKPGNEISVIKKGSLVYGISESPSVKWQVLQKKQDISAFCSKYFVTRDDESSYIFDILTGKEVPNPFPSKQKNIIHHCTGDEFHARTEKGVFKSSQGKLVKTKAVITSFTTGDSDFTVEHEYRVPEGKGNWTAINLDTGKAIWSYTHKKSEGEIGTLKNIIDMPVRKTSLFPSVFNSSTGKYFITTGPAGKCIYFIKPADGNVFKSLCFYRTGYPPLVVTGTPWIILSAVGPAYFPPAVASGEVPADEGYTTIWALNTDTWKIKEIIKDPAKQSIMGPVKVPLGNSPFIFTVFQEKVYIKKSKLQAWKITDLK